MLRVVVAGALLARRGFRVVLVQLVLNIARHRSQRLLVTVLPTVVVVVVRPVPEPQPPQSVVQQATPP